MNAREQYKRAYQVHRANRNPNRVTLASYRYLNTLRRDVVKNALESLNARGKEGK